MCHCVSLNRCFGVKFDLPHKLSQTEILLEVSVLLVEDPHVLISLDNVLDAQYDISHALLLSNLLKKWSAIVFNLSHLFIVNTLWLI